MDVLLSDRDLRAALGSGDLIVTPLADRAIQPASIDLRLDRSFRIFDNHRHGMITPLVEQPGLTRLEVVRYHEPFILHPGEFVLASTMEKVSLSAGLAAQLAGKSSLGRLGVVVHATAGFIDPGFCGQITLELSNVANLPVQLWPEMKIGQLCVYRLSSPAERPYGHAELGSKYQNQGPAVPSSYHRNRTGGN